MAWPNPPKTWVTGELVDATDLNTELRDALNAIFPVGTFILRAATYTTVETAVEGRWLQCNGVAVSRTTYSVLFTYLNGLSPALPFGTGDGVTTFTLPDLRGRTAVAEGEHANVDSMGDSDGVAIANRQPQHRHTVVSFGTGSGGGQAISAPSSFTAQSSFNNSEIGPASSPLDAPAYLVVGSYFIKYTS